ncbi:MAG: DNA-directed RNA polymerase [Nanoarchaeota archaeon]|nr:DNA-directed RNA polymerase [Nanoarchaeota archaeon]
MFYETELRQYVRVSPMMFNFDTKTAILKELNESFTKNPSKEVGIIIAIIEIKKIGDGIIIQGDGAPYYDTTFKALVFKPELQEVIHGVVTDITEFGAFMSIGPLDGMIHIGQTMDDFVSYSKTGVLTGKETKRTLKIRDNCKARVVAVSYKNIENPKVGLTMRQAGLGREEWMSEIVKKPKETKNQKKKRKNG